MALTSTTVRVIIVIFGLRRWTFLFMSLCRSRSTLFGYAPWLPSLATLAVELVAPFPLRTMAMAIRCALAQLLPSEVVPTPPGPTNQNRLIAEVADAAPLPRFFSLCEAGGQKVHRKKPAQRWGGFSKAVVHHGLQYVACMQELVCASVGFRWMALGSPDPVGVLGVVAPREKLNRKLEAEQPMRVFGP